jgi:hypothetical protein
MQWLLTRGLTCWHENNVNPDSTGPLGSSTWTGQKYLNWPNFTQNGKVHVGSLKGFWMIHRKAIKEIIILLRGSGFGSNC